MAVSILAQRRCIQLGTTRAHSGGRGCPPSDTWQHKSAIISCQRLKRILPCKLGYAGMWVHIFPSGIKLLVKGRIHPVVIHIVPCWDDKVTSVQEAKLPHGSSYLQKKERKNGGKCRKVGLTSSWSLAPEPQSPMATKWISSSPENFTCLKSKKKCLFNFCCRFTSQIVEQGSCLGPGYFCSCQHCPAQTERRSLQERVKWSEEGKSMQSSRKKTICTMGSCNIYILNSYLGRLHIYQS